MMAGLDIIFVKYLGKPLVHIIYLSDKEIFGVMTSDTKYVWAGK